MFFHLRNLKYVKYGKVKGFIEDKDAYIPAYKWIESYCGYYPQVWLSRSTSYITGKRVKKEGILFGFEHIGNYNDAFYIDFNQWDHALVFLYNYTNDYSHRGIKPQTIENDLKDYFNSLNREFPNDKIFKTYDFDDWKNNYLFIENDQVVLPNVNLKSAKEIICKNERQKKVLRKMGFIEDRIKIMNLKLKRPFF